MYQDFYKLTGKPFQLNPAPGYYFPSKGHKRAYAYLKYGVYEGEGFIVISGEIGAGKTTLVQALMGELDSKFIVAAQLVNTHIDATDLVRAVSDAFGLPVQEASKQRLLTQFESFLGSLADSGRRALLIVDEAQNLSPPAMEELRMLSNFQRGSHALLQSFLVGQPELREILLAPSMTQLRQRIIASYHLGPLDRSETREYVLHRLGCVGWKGDPRLDDAIFDSLHAASGGLPRLINTFCHRLFLNACMSESHVIGSADFTETFNDLRDEIGAGSPRDSAAAAGRGSAQRGAGVVHPFLSSAVTTRLDRIEKTLGTAVDLLQQITGEEGKSPAAAAAGKQRFRFGGRAQGNS